MKLNVKNVDLQCIQRNTKALLMSKERVMYAIDEIVVEEFNEIHKSFLGKPKNVKVRYITAATVMGYNSKGRFIGSLDDMGAQMFLKYHDHDIMRNNWRDFRKELEAFGVRIKGNKTQDTAELKNELAAQQEELASEFAKLGAQVLNESK